MVFQRVSSEEHLTPTVWHLQAVIVYVIVQRQTAVAAYFKSKQLLLFDFARQKSTT